MKKNKTNKQADRNPAASKLIDAYGIRIRALTKGEGGGYLAVFPQLGGMVNGLGETREEALSDLLSSVPTLLQSLAEYGEKLPAPEVEPEWQEYSGRVTLRVPKMLHAQLDRLADREGVSLNTFMLTALQSAATAAAAGQEFGAISSENAEKAAFDKEMAVFRHAYEKLVAVFGDSAGEAAKSSDRWLQQREAQRRTEIPRGWEVLSEAG